MIIHNLSDFPYQYVTREDERDVCANLREQLRWHKPHFCTKTDKWVQDWHNDPNHNIEPKTRTREISLTLAEYNKAGTVPLSRKTLNLVENLTNAYESDKRVERYFLGQQGEVWVLWHITDIPEVSGYEHIVRDGWGFTAKDGTVTIVTSSLFFTKERAMEHIREDVTDLASYARYTDEAFYSHVYELSQM